MRTRPLKNEDRLGRALELAKQFGFPVFPCHYIIGDHCSCPKGKKRDGEGNPSCISGKHPATPNGFKNASVDETAIQRMWTNRNFNIGLATGHESPNAVGEHRYLTVVDVDVSDGKVGRESLAALIARYGELPETLTLRTGSGGTHYYYLTRRPVASFKANDPEQQYPLGLHIDVRGEGGYVVTAGSNHISGDTYEFSNPGTPIAPMPTWMETLLAGSKGPKKASSSGKTSPLLSEDKPDEAVAEALYVPSEAELYEALEAIPVDLRNDYDAGSGRPGCWWEVGAALRTLSDSHPDKEHHLSDWKEWARRAPRFATDWSKNIRQWESDHERQWRSFKPHHFFFETIVYYARKNKKYKAPEGLLQAQREKASRDAISLNQPDKGIAEDVQEALEKLSCNKQPLLFRFGSEIARPRRILRRGILGEYEYQIEPLRKNTALLQALNHELKFIRFLKDGSVSPANLSKETAEHILQCQPDQFVLPPVNGITTTPVMLPDGSIYNEPGYSETTRLFHFPEVQLQKVEERPSKKDIRAAAELLEEVYCDIPFTDPSDKAHALGLLMVALLRTLIEGDTPGHFITKPVQGTGATLLANVPIYLKTGLSEVYPQNAPSRDDEWQKTILADLLTGVDFCFYDDCKTLRSPILATVLTSKGSYKGRKLGVNTMLHVPNRAIWMFVGNNPQISKDLRRRLVDIRIDAEMADPTARGHFKHPDILPWLKSPGVRGAIISAIFTLARGWIAQGRPGGKLLASFQDWSHVIGGILEIAGIKGFQDSPKNRLVDEQEMETNEFIYCLVAHRLRFPPGCGNGNPSFARLKASQILEMADNCGLEIVAGIEGQGRDRAKKFATEKLNPLRDRVFQVLACANATPEELNQPDSFPALDVKLTYNPIAGDAYWKVVFRSTDSKGNRTWSDEPAPDKRAIKGEDVWAGMMWDNRGQRLGGAT